ncbi:PREDICTED: uncharacterized protein LOC108780024 [Cyphomyrmex costatus]|uniref:uncharacterized protein LOC108780024 n=1 Tax=Cyphomyrmex costatus TaxID=456900 RepID=UPI0008522265|nr:PREDICTED: uncharacterized protein LOC108780024 [Cyphomyrmex costatus]
MENYSAQEYADMIIVYGETDRNARFAARLYAEQFPRRAHPTYSVILRCIRRLRETGSVLRIPHYDGGRMRVGVNMEERILEAFEENPRNSIRHAAHALEVSRLVVHRTLRENQLHPYHFQRVQQLLERDEVPRICF